MAERINAEDFDGKVLTDGFHLVDFYSDSCVPCKMMSPVLAGLETEYGDKLNVFKVNVAYASDLTERYQVLSVPTLIFFKNGEEAGRLTGAQKKDDLVEFIDKNI